MRVFLLLVLAGLLSATTRAFVVPFVSGRSSVLATTTTPARTTAWTDLHMTVLTYKGKKKNFKAGSPLSRAVAGLGVPVKYSCKKGDCATCQVNLAGRYVRCCTGKVPDEPKLKSLQEKGLEIKV